MNSILETLYKERKSLKEKLDKLEALIVSYGGSLEKPTAEQVAMKPFENEGFAKIGLTVQNYQNASWKQKIEAAINELGKPSSVVEITDFLCRIDRASDRAKVHKSVTLYCSSLSIKGELGVDKTGDVNRFFTGTK